MSKGKQQRKEQRRQRKGQERRTGGIVVEEKKITQNETKPPAEATGDPAKEVKASQLVRFWGWVRDSSSFTDWCIAAFTAVLVTVSIYQLGAMIGQLNVLSGQLDTMRKDQRAWISIEEKQDLLLFANKPLVAILNVKNTGKTPASHISGKAWIELVPNAAQPHFEAEYLGHVVWFTGMILPGTTHEREVDRTDVKPGSKVIPAPLVLTEDELRSINESRAWVAVHGIVEYEDVFKAQHWVRFCYPTAHQPGSYSFGSCVAYNQVDDN